MKNKLDLQALSKNAQASIEFVVKDLKNTGRKLKKTPFDDENMDKYQANLTEATFFLNAFALASKAFNKMVKEKQDNPKCERTLADYFLDESVAMQALDMKRKEQENEIK